MFSKQQLPSSVSFFFSFAVLGLELRAYTFSISTSPFFVMGVFQIGSHELFDQDGLGLWANKISYFMPRL
jgi:hypothetical protein